MHAILWAFVVLVIVFAAWRFASRRKSLPCPVWLKWMVELENPFARVARSSFIVEHLELKPGMTVLDLGCGPGRVAIPAALKVAPGGNVVAVDIQEGMLERAKVKAAEAGVKNIEFLQAGAGEGRLGTDRFDRALLVTVLGEIPEREAAIKEVFDSLKTGGILSITEIVFDPHFQRQSTVRKIATQAGFKKKAVYGNALAYTMHFEKA